MKRFLPLLLALHLAAPAWGALTNVYCDFDDAGSSNLGTLAEPYNTWSSCFGSLAAGQCILVKRTSARHNPGANQTIATNASSTQPIIIIGYNSSVPDCTASPIDYGDGASGTANWFQYGARQLTISGDNIWLHYFDLTHSATSDTALMLAGPAGQRAVHVNAVNTSTGGLPTAARCGQASVFAGGQAKASPGGSSAGYAAEANLQCFFIANRVDLTGSTSTGAYEGIRAHGVASNIFGAVSGNVVRGPDASGAEIGIKLTNTTSSDDRGWVTDNTIVDFDKGIAVTGVPTGTAGNVTIIGNLTQNVNTSFDNLDGSAGNRGLVDYANFYDSNTTDWDNTGTGVPRGQFVNLSADSCTSASTWDCTLNNTAGGGASCRDAAEPLFFNLELTANDEEPGANAYQDAAGAGASSSLGALTDRYANFDGTGTDSGTLANPWLSWASVVSGVAAGDRVCVKQTASRHETGATFTTDASTSAKILLEGYKTTCGDGGDDGINNYFQSGSVSIALQAGYHVKFFDFTGDPGAGNYLVDAPDLNQWTCEFCYIKDTNTSKTVSVVNLDDEGTLLNSHVVVPTNATGVMLADAGAVWGSTIDMTASGANGIEFTNDWVQYGHIKKTVIFGSGSGRAIFGHGDISPEDAQDETAYDNSPTTEGTFAGGTGYSVSDVITLSDSSTATVDAVSGGVVTQFTIANSASTGADVGDTLTQSSVAPAGGSGFTLTLDYDNIEAVFTDGDLGKARMIELNTIRNVREGIVFGDTKSVGGAAMELVVNNLIYDVELGVWNINGTSCAGATIMYNACGGETVACYKNWSDCPVEFGAVDIPSDPHEDAAAGDFRLKATATEVQGAALSVSNFTGSGTLARHLGAVQAVAPAAAGRPKIW